MIPNAIKRASPRLPGSLRDRLFQKEWATIRRELQSACEPWQTIPWKLSLLEARAQAMRERKPVVMLVRSGHPLGGT